jgi:spoIIIJ-associated protein
MSDNLTQDHVTAEPEQDVEGSQESLESVDAPISESSATDDVDVDADVTDVDADVTDAEDAEDAEDGDAGGDAPAAPALSNRRANLEREGEVAADFLETLLDICDLDGDIDVDIDGDRAAVSVVDSEDGRVPRRLVGPNGQVLEALQELTRLAVQSATGERSRLMLDVAGHRAERRATLVTLAKEAIDEVRATGERKPLSPMTAFERKVVHDEVLAAGLVSESEGAEPRRYVVILPA